MNFPERDEFVVVKVTQILNYGVFAELLEYNNAKGFVHISNVSSSWVKNIRNLVKINQVRVAKVLNVDLQKKQIDLSFAGISPQMEKQKMVEFKQVNREEKLIALLAKQESKNFDVVWGEVANPLIEEFGSLYKALEKISLGEDISKFVDKKWVEPLKEMVDKNIVVSKKTLKGKAVAKSLSDNGLEAIKNLFEKINGTKGCEVIYGGAGTYLISFTALTFKGAEKLMNKVIEEAENEAKKMNVQFSFKEDEEK